MRVWSGRLILYVRRGDKQRWRTISEEEGLGLSQWVRHTLQRAPKRPAPLDPNPELFDDSLQLRVRDEDKSQWERLAQEQDLTLAEWIRRELNDAVRRYTPEGTALP